MIMATTYFYHLPVLKELVGAGADLNLMNKVMLELYSITDIPLFLSIRKD